MSLEKTMHILLLISKEFKFLEFLFVVFVQKAPSSLGPFLNKIIARSERFILLRAAALIKCFVVLLPLGHNEDQRPDQNDNIMTYFL